MFISFDGLYEKMNEYLKCKTKEISEVCYLAR